ncbi:hypothetical protein EJ03DRAFT_62506 [Teratosphaeria nubilosa]|uniref:Queuosine 5'-phosphate N-glycosylase/hydrolase n=1 Tax=Teratosphaeria nubilosa TaxID=161662 RepID=A0A6G1KSP2_9PEZI|nr:hypothetical protein EJ03DRAFT_62506 [Teratosphaeria nubilosa]
MSDDEADPELLELLRQSLGINRTRTDEISSDTGVLKDAQYIYNNAIDVSVDMYGTKAAAASIYKAMQEREYSTETWSQVELHPKASEGFSELDMVNFIFTMDLLNFSFWSSLPESDRYQVEYRGRRWTGYNSLLAALRRALDEEIPITTPRFWRDGNATDRELRHVFRSATDEEMPLLDQRVKILREAADVLRESFSDPEEEVDQELDMSTQQPGDQQEVQKTTETLNDLRIDDSANEVGTVPEEATHGPPNEVAYPTPPHSEHLDTNTETPSPTDSTVAGAPDDRPTPHPLPKPTHHPDHSITTLIHQATHSTGKLVNLLVQTFPSFNDRTRFDGKRVRLHKRAQILVADLWAAFNGRSYGEFHDVEHLTMFADYRVPQILHALGVLRYSPPLHYCIVDGKEIPAGHSWEVQLRGCSVWAVELIRREIVAEWPEARRGGGVNAVLIDFFLYDLAKEREREGRGEGLPHHRTRSIWY